MASDPSIRPLERLRAILDPGLDALRTSEHTRLMFLGVVAGAIGGGAAGGFDFLLRMISILLLGDPEPSLASLAWYKALFAPGLAGLAAGLFVQIGTERKRPQGIPDVIEGVVLADGRVSLREGLASASASAFAVGGGMSGGREGPTVQLASALVSHACRRAGIRPHHARILVAAGAAAGIAASFNTPVGAAFFALEILIGNFALSSFAPVVTATVTGTVFGQWLLGEDRVALTLPPFQLEHPASLLIYPLLGVLGGVVAVAFKRMLLEAGPLWDRTSVPRWARPALAGLGVGVLGAVGLNPIMGNGYGFMDDLVSGGSYHLWFVALVLVAKMVATAACASSGSGTGIFSPSLFVGAVTGVLFGQLANLVAPSIAGPAGAYGMVGMGAVAAAITQAPITHTLMLFEMTQNYQVILPLLLTLAVAGLVSAVLESGSIYVKQLEARGVNVDRAREELVMYDLKVQDVMRTGQCVTVHPGEAFGVLAERFLGTRGDEIYVIDEQGRFTGFIDIQDVKGLLAEPREGVTAQELAHADVPTVQPFQPLADAMPLFFRSGLEALPVLDPAGKLLGMLLERDVVGAYNREVLRKDALLARVESGRGGERHTDFLVLPEGTAIDRVDVGPGIAGTLRELELPERYGLSVVAADVRQPDGSMRRTNAGADLVLKEGDVLIVMGPEEAIIALREGAPPPEASRES